MIRRGKIEQFFSLGETDMVQAVFLEINTGYDSQVQSGINHVLDQRGSRAKNELYLK
jgi:hypothetical protein